MQDPTRARQVFQHYVISPVQTKNTLTEWCKRTGIRKLSDLAGFIVLQNHEQLEDCLLTCHLIIEGLCFCYFCFSNSVTDILHQSESSKCLFRRLHSLSTLYQLTCLPPHSPQLLVPCSVSYYVQLCYLSVDSLLVIFHCDIGQWFLVSGTLVSLRTFGGIWK